MQLISRQRLTHVRAMVVATVALVVVAGATLAAHRAEGAPAKPNVVFILTDDMPTSELAGMSNVRSLIAAQGTTFNEAYVSFPLCCPSRATMMSGLYMHNHGVRGNFPPQGSWLKFRPRESNDLPVWLQADGYYNVHIGKYMNGYAVQDGTLPVPTGWNEWYGKVAEDALYFDYQLIEKTGPGATPHITFYGDQPSDYQTDTFTDRAVNFVKDLDSSTQEPFWLNLWFNSPHGPFDPAPRDLFRLAGTPLPKLPGVNEKDISDKPKWLRRQVRKQLSKKQLKLIDNERRRQQEQLLSVDQAVGELFEALQSRGILDNTYVIFASDNGFFRGEHRIASGKYLPYDPSSRVPLLIRGPGIPHGGVSNELVWNGDIAQTIDQIASGSENPAADGRSFMAYAENPARRSTRPILLEGDTGPGGTGAESAQATTARAREARVGVAGKRGVHNLEQERDAIKSANNTNAAPAYRSIRTDRYEYTVYANGQTELYDMKRDPAQLNSLALDPRYRYVRKWLFDQLAVLSVCAGASCRVEIGPDPAPLPKSAVRPNRKKQGPGTNQATAKP
jgi:N-acetylglucosamine-6-sulfatase